MEYLRSILGHPRHPQKTEAEESRHRLEETVKETRAGAAALVVQVRKEKAQADRVTMVARDALRDLRTVERQL